MHSLIECCIKPIEGKIWQDIMHWQSDYLILPKNLKKLRGGKGVAVRQGGEGDSHHTWKWRYG